MAKLPNGMNGPLIGRIGNMVWYMLNDDNVGRLIGDPGPQNNNQKATAKKFSLISPFLAVVTDFVGAGFKNTRKAKAKQTAQSYAQSVNMKNAVTGTYPRQKVDYCKVIVSEGDLAAPSNPKVKQNGNNLEIRWKADMEGMNADENDQLMALVYLPDDVRQISVLTGARRTEEFQNIPVPALTKKTTMYVHIAFVNPDRTDVSNSVFVKKVIWKPLTT